MPTDSAALAFYVVLLVVILGSLLGNFRIAKMLKQALVWVVIFAAVTALFTLRDDLPGTSIASVQQEGEAIVLRRSGDGHFYATAQVNGVDIRFVVDTGATQIVLNQEDAGRIGFDPDNLSYWGRAFTANGEVRTARIKLKELRLGDRVDENVTAAVNDGRLDTSLLGMSYLNRFSKIEIEGRVLRLIP